MPPLGIQIAGNKLDREFIMGCNTESKQIGEREYSVTQWPAEKSILMKMRLIKAFGAPIASIFSGIDMSGKEKKNKDIDVDPAVFVTSLETLFQNSTPQDITTLLKDCVVGAACNGTRITESSFSELFSGDDLADLYRVTLFVVQVNYANLFKGQLAQRLLAKTQEHL